MIGIGSVITWSPQVIEDQVTYPLTTALLAVPRSKVVRGFPRYVVSTIFKIRLDGCN
jgi:Cu(I)/Ag(I) efflux system membrane protein CusA/SilA